MLRVVAIFHNSAINAKLRITQNFPLHKNFHIYFILHISHTEVNWFKPQGQKNERPKQQWTIHRLKLFLQSIRGLSSYHIINLTILAKYYHNFLSWLALLRVPHLIVNNVCVKSRDKKIVNLINSIIIINSLTHKQQHCYIHCCKVIMKHSII